MTSRGILPLLRFTGERLHIGSSLFAADLARHEAAYDYARALMEAGTRGWVLDLGSGSGYGTRRLAATGLPVVGIDRVPPDPPLAGAPRSLAARFVLGDLLAPPFERTSFAWLVSLQVIEHLTDPHPYLAAAARLLEPRGTALFSTPNRLRSDGINPHHSREYTGPELTLLLARHFTQVELLAVGTSEPARRYQEARRRQIDRLLALDPLGLRLMLPRAFVERAFGILAVIVRLLIRRRLDSTTITSKDYPIGPYTEDSLDLLAVCRE